MFWLRADLVDMNLSYDISEALELLVDTNIDDDFPTFTIQPTNVK